ncbi:MAG: hypothetical protein H7337_06105 [Rhizobacter sp.]|nr:hypothetical protein [Rhizobacter sp.]
MTLHRPTLFATRACVTALALAFAVPAAVAQTAAPKHSAAGKKTAPAVPKKPVELVLVAASAEQIEAAGQVFYGVYECEFKQTVDIEANLKYPSYVNVKHGKSDYLMKPVESSTGAIRLEDVRGETLMVQISSKSMLLNVRTGQRVVDDCITPKQRELVEAARAAKAAATAEAAALAVQKLSTIEPAPTE